MTGDERGALVCSRRGCGDPATWGLVWNNPRVHTPDRRKVWLACDEHRQWLADYLDTRGFLREVVPADALPESAGRRDHP